MLATNTQNKASRWPWTESLPMISALSGLVCMSLVQICQPFSAPVCTFSHSQFMNRSVSAVYLKRICTIKLSHLTKMSWDTTKMWRLIKQYHPEVLNNQVMVVFVGGGLERCLSELEQLIIFCSCWFWWVVRWQRFTTPIDSTRWKVCVFIPGSRFDK